MDNMEAKARELIMRELLTFYSITFGITSAAFLLCCLVLHPSHVSALHKQYIRKRFTANARQLLALKSLFA